MSPIPDGTSAVTDESDAKAATESDEPVVRPFRIDSTDLFHCNLSIDSIRRRIIDDESHQDGSVTVTTRSACEPVCGACAATGEGGDDGNV